jgi:hypothetical protein
MTIVRTAAFYIGLTAILVSIGLILLAVFYPCAGDAECIGTLGGAGLIAFIPFGFGIVVLITSAKAPRHTTK